MKQDTLTDTERVAEHRHRTIERKLVLIESRLWVLEREGASNSEVRGSRTYLQTSLNQLTEIQIEEEGHKKDG